MVPKWPVSTLCPCRRVAPPFSSDYQHSSQAAAAGAQTTTISLLKTGKKAERKMLERGLMTKGNAGCPAGTAGRGAGRVSLCHSPGPSAGGRCCGRGLRTARPPLAAEDRLRLVAVRCAVPALWSAAALAAHSTCIWCICRLGCTVSTDYTRTRTGFFTGWLSARCWTLDTGLGLELGMSTDNTQATPDAVLSPASLTTHHLIYYHIMLSSPIYFLCVEPYPIKFLTLTLCVLSNTLKALKYTANCSPLSAARGLQDAANVRLPRI